MAKFLLHLFQDGGCDYTISCGEAIYEFEANSGDEIRRQIKERIEYYGRDEISSVTLYEITDNKSQIDIAQLFAEDDDAEARREREKKELEERKLLDELKKKYPDA